MTRTALLGVHFFDRRLPGFHGRLANLLGDHLRLGDGFTRHRLDTADHTIAGLAHELMLFLGLRDEETGYPAEHGAKSTDRDRVRLHHLPESLSLLLHLPGAFPHLIGNLADDLARLTDGLTSLAHDLSGHFLYLTNSLLGLASDLSRHLLSLPALLVRLATVATRGPIATDGSGRTVAALGPVRTVVG